MDQSIGLENRVLVISQTSGCPEGTLFRGKLFTSIPVDLSSSTIWKKSAFGLTVQLSVVKDSAVYNVAS